MTQNYVILFDKMAESKFEVSVVREAANRSAVRLGYSLGLKKEQMEVVVAFMTGNDVFAVCSPYSGYWLWQEFVLCLPSISFC